jgi:hypothetical protein
MCVPLAQQHARWVERRAVKRESGGHVRGRYPAGEGMHWPEDAMLAWLNVWTLCGRNVAARYGTLALVCDHQECSVFLDTALRRCLF